MSNKSEVKSDYQRGLDDMQQRCIESLEIWKQVAGPNVKPRCPQAHTDYLIGCLKRIQEPEWQHAQSTLPLSPDSMGLDDEAADDRMTWAFAMCDRLKKVTQERDEARAALAPQPNGTEASRGVIPAGWKLVPEKPTPEMLKAGYGEHWSWSSGRAYCAMLAAAPTLPLSAGTEPAEICHDDQLAIWSGDIIGSLGMGGYLREDVSYDDKLHMYALVDAEVKGICAAITPSAPIAAPVRDDGALEAPEACLNISRRKLARITRAWEAKANLDDGDICFLIRMAEQRLDAPAGDVPGEAQPPVSAPAVKPVRNPED